MSPRIIDLIYTVCMEDDLTKMNGMTPDEILDHLGCTVDDDGEILDADENPTGIWYDEII